MYNSVSAGGSVASLSESSETISDESNNVSQATDMKLMQKRKASLQPTQRPPWRAIANPAPPPKADKEAMMKAKILDASRRALMKQRMYFTNVSMQTDPLPTKLMRDVCLDQTGLIVLKDKGILTDGNVLIKKQTGQFILTNSVAQLTDLPLRDDKGTQTALPRSEVAFMKLYQPDLEGIKRDVHELSRSSVQQKEKNRVEISNLLKSLKAGPESFFGPDETQQVNETLDSLDFGAIRQDQLVPPDIIKSSGGDSQRNGPVNTYANWTDLHFDDDQVELPRNIFTEGQEPWKNYKDVVLGNRISQMRLSPAVQRRTTSTKKKTVTWSDTHQQLVANLLTEASNLIQLFDQVSILLGPKLNIPATPPKMESPGPLPSMYQAKAQQDSLELQKQLMNFQPRTFKASVKLGEEFKQYLQK